MYNYIEFSKSTSPGAKIMRKKAYLVVLPSLITILLLVSCTNPVDKDIFINISLTGEAVNTKFSTTPASFHDKIVVNKYKV